VAHATVWSAASTTASGVVFMGISIAAVVAVATRIGIGVAVAGCSIPIAMVVGAQRRAHAKAAVGPACASPGIAVTYLGAPGGVRAFSFESPTYTARFAEHNAAALTRVSAELRRLIEGHRIARLIVPTPASPVSVVSAPPTVAEWIARIEAQAGRIARRNTLARALEAAHEPEDRDRLVAAASRLELAPVFDQIDERSSTAARRRQLEAAIAGVRADNLSDELRDAMLRELEARLRALG
jgi:hypothetical protein